MNTAFFLIKPVSSLCNLACRYCFYHDLAEHRLTRDYGLMDSRTSDLLIERAFDLGVGALTFIFQGGEPTLAGLEYFEHFVEKCRACAESDSHHRPQINFSIQTNGVSLNAEWARFFKREGFLVGASVDGPRIIHDTYRTYRDGSGTWAQVMHGITVLREEGVPVNALCVVNNLTADNAGLVYHFLRRRGFDWIQFIPCLAPLAEEPAAPYEALNPEAYAHFLKEIFDLRYGEWLRGSGQSVRWFDNLVEMAAGLPPESCGMLGCCPMNFTVEADGSVYPCDFYAADEWCLGNIHELSFQVMQEGITAHDFVESSRLIDPVCKTCSAFFLCRGGCRRDREPFSDGKPRLNRYCPAFKEFFQYAGARIMRMAAALKETI
ncbi:Anaerobic sulfatase-maturating enzyme [uncultured spirochete]|uniref:Anaerobic sulfatase-maturating enzyme n=1 Tax=uncultured spirochete TaxID=156406 RepID=A0A3P3XN89_9SPIR|nr:Anaerobic sulfatase-maturating enzyme [uncultured spirochete]